MAMLKKKNKTNPINYCISTHEVENWERHNRLIYYIYINKYISQYMSACQTLSL